MENPDEKCDSSDDQMGIDQKVTGMDFYRHDSPAPVQATGEATLTMVEIVNSEA
jgi:hypothetical protein